MWREVLAWIQTMNFYIFEQKLYYEKKVVMTNNLHYHVSNGKYVLRANSAQRFTFKFK